MCAQCGFAFNRTFDASKLSYGPNYENTQLSSEAFTEHVDGLVRHMIEECQVRDSSIVEVGCGKGGFLRALIAPDGANNTGIGFDPSYIGPDVEFDGRLRFERRFYDSSCTNVPADVVVCRHVIEHVADPVGLLQSIHAAVSEHVDARLFLETPCVDWIFGNSVVWDLFYEHCSLFTSSSLSAACVRAGFAVTSVRHVFGGQYLWLEATNAWPGPITPGSGNTADLAREFAAAYDALVAGWRERVDRLAQTESLAIWGAGAKGVTFANLVDPCAERFRCVVDINPAKQSGFVAGTGHPIVAPSDLATYGVTGVVVLNPNYLTEVELQLRAIHSSARVIEIK